MVQRHAAGGAIPGCTVCSFKVLLVEASVPCEAFHSPCLVAHYGEIVDYFIEGFGITLRGIVVDTVVRSSSGEAFRKSSEVTVVAASEPFRTRKHAAWWSTSDRPQLGGLWSKVAKRAGDILDQPWHQCCESTAVTKCGVRIANPVTSGRAVHRLQPVGRAVELGPAGELGAYTDQRGKRLFEPV
ncbi:hypothetical protein BAY59_04765 [Prauserella coralliicola]|nr:hypothetical protein BAY59_04765 [Prauserella coralliicola]